MALFNLPPPPNTEDIKSFVWRDWFFKLQQAVGSIFFVDLDFTGSNITSIATRNHNDLQSFQGGTPSEYYHLTASQHSDLTTLGTSNQLFGMDNAASGWEYKTISGSQNVTITHSANNITVSSTSGIQDVFMLMGA